MTTMTAWNKAVDNLFFLHSIYMDFLAPEEKLKIIQQYLNDPLTTGGRDRLWKHIRQQYPQITRREVADALKNDPIAQIHHPLKKRITTRPIVVSDRAKQSQIDLVDFKGLTGYNDSHRYILTYVDLLSKYCAARAITKKTASNVNTALMDILDSMPKSWRPRTIQADNGSEFKSLMEKSLAERGIKMVHSQAYNPRSQGSIERFNRNLKSALFSLMARHNTSRWLDFVQPLIENFNNTVHESTGYTPNDLMKRPELTKKVIDEVHARMERRRPKQAVAVHSELALNDYVRIALTADSAIRKQTFRKKIKNNWSNEVYQIYAISAPEAAGAQPQYLVKNLMTNRKSKKRYWSYQLLTISAESAEQAVQQPNKPESESEEEEDEEQEPIVPAPIRRTARAYQPSQQALQNFAQARSR